MAFAMSAALMAVAVSMFMMVTMHIRIISKIAFQKSLYRIICIAGDTSVKSDSCFSQCILRSAAYAPADEYIHLVSGQKSCQSSMSASVCIYDLLSGYFSVLGIIYLKLLRMAEVLENLSVFISHCYSHNVLSSLFFQNSSGG